MAAVSSTIAIILVVSAIVQGFLVAAFVRALAGFRGEADGVRSSRRTAVILCLRGCDPFLEECLESIFEQEHSDYQLHIVVDNRQDPAWKVAESLVKRFGSEKVQIEALEDRQSTCSLKCSSVVQAIRRLDDSFENVALVDADTMPHRAWLGDLTAPLTDEGVGAATGNRWYMPETSSWGAMVRYLWNAAAVVQMYWYEIAWGGTLAVKRTVIDELGLLDRWSRAFCEDTMLRRQLGKHGLRVKFVPSLMMVNREDVGLASCLSWISRQLLTARLYHPLWLLVLAHGLGTTVVLVAAIAVTVIAAINGNWPAVVWCAGGLFGYEFIMVSLLIPMELAVRRIVRSRGESTRWFSAKTLVRLVPAIVLTQLVYTVALLLAQFGRKVDWRGVSYEIGGSWDIRRLDDGPYAGEAAVAPEGHSL
jgi:cellulose synthase/poly-beta-1,6-N-acetylglucosamine synthase-like glycosyltransferase